MPLDGTEATEAVEERTSERAALTAERQAMLARVNDARTAAAQAAGALAAATEALQRESPQEAQLRQQLIRVGGLLGQAEQLQVDTLTRQRALADAEQAADQGLGELEQQMLEAAASVRQLVAGRQETELRAALARRRIFRTAKR